MDWTSYDSAAATHDRLRVPVIFAPPARDLAARMEFASARSALDVGTGSGVVAAAASACSFVAGVDPSVEMLRISRRNGQSRVAVAVVPGLPFGDATFDRVTAGFVLSHVPQYEAALADIVRVLRSGGMFGATSWSQCRSEHHDVWDAVLERFADPAVLKAAHDRALPWEDRLSRAENVRGDLASAGLRDIQAEEIVYPIRMTIADFLEMRGTSFSARFFRASAGDDALTRFQDAADEELRRRFSDPIDYTRGALIATARR